MTALVAEVRKVPAFLRRDLLTMLRIGRVHRRPAGDRDAGGHVRVRLETGRLVSAADLQRWRDRLLRVRHGRRRDRHGSGLLLQKVSTAIRQEQMTGTLEALLVTPTSPTTVQVGWRRSTVFIPVRMTALLLAVALAFGLGFEPSGIAAKPRGAGWCASSRSSGDWASSPPPRSSTFQARRWSGRLRDEHPRPRVGRLLPADPPAGMDSTRRGGKPGRDHPGTARAKR